MAMLEIWTRQQPTRTEWDASALVWLGFSRQRHLLKGKKSLTRPVDHPMPEEREGFAPWLKFRSEGDLHDELKNMLQGAGWARVGPPCHPLSSLTGIVGGPRLDHATGADDTLCCQCGRCVGRLFCWLLRIDPRSGPRGRRGGAPADLGQERNYDRNGNTTTNVGRHLPLLSAIELEKLCKS